MSPQQRAEQGPSFLDLESIEEEAGLGGCVLVTLARRDRARFAAHLDNGDQVAVFPRRSEIRSPCSSMALPCPTLVRRRTRPVTCIHENHPLLLGASVRRARVRQPIGE